MSLPQIEAALAACSRRDADLALTVLNSVHKAVAPLIVGEEGWEVFREYHRSLITAIEGEKPTSTQEADTFTKMLAEARENEKSGIT